jgi:hypothetical protein
MWIKFGKKQSIMRVAVVSLVFSGIVATLSRCLNVEQSHVEDLADEINRRTFRNKDINDQFISNPRLLQRRINRDIDRELQRYNNYEERTRVPRMKNVDILNGIQHYDKFSRVIIEDAIYYELDVKEPSALGRPMGIRAVWTEPHPNEIDQ